MALNGIDISNWQSGINLEAVPADFVIVKATEGLYYVSPSCDRQYQQAKKAGRKLGVYHYANGNDAVSEAEYFLKNIKGYIHEAILVLDWESQNNPKFNSGQDRAWVKTWCDHVAAQTGVKPLVYISASYRHLVSGIGDYGLWIAQYANNNRTGYQDTPWNEGAYSCAIRQYSSAGSLSGYSGNLDLNKFYGDRTAWDKYANPSGAASSAPEVRMASVQLYDGNATDAQRWAVQHNDDGTVTLTSKSCSLALDVAGAGTSSGTAVRVYTSNQTDAQRWFVIQKSGDYAPDFTRPVEFAPKVNEELRLDCVGGGKENGTGIQVYTNNGTSAQQWQILDHGDGTWTLINVGSSQALDVVGGGN